MDPASLIKAVASALGMSDAAPLTEGGQKIVLKGNLGGQSAVAKVVLLTGDPVDNIIMERALREVEFLSAVESDHVVKIVADVVEIGDPPFAICWAEEFLSGSDISPLLRTRWSEDETWKLLADIGSALAACHEMGVVHRDLSPGNVRRTESGSFVLMDPGLARHLEKTAITGHYQPGTPGWRSPEHVPGGNPLPASDIYALGILAYYALTNTFPIDPNGSELEYNHRLVEEQALPVESHRSNLSPALASIVNRCLNRQPARRFLDGAELAESLTSAGKGPQ